MFSDRQMEVNAVVDDFEREVQLVMLRNDARQARSIEDRPKGVRFPLPEWLKRAPLVLRATHR